MIYQRVPCASLGGGLFRHSLERTLVEHLHHAMWERAGGIWEQDGDPRERAQRQEFWHHNRGRWHTLKRIALSVVNSQIGQMLEEAADMNAVRAARRFPANRRQELYRSFIENGDRAVQLAHSFPALALLTYSEGARIGWRGVGGRRVEMEATASEAADMVRRGVETKKIAEVFGLPLSYKKFHPGVTERAIDAHEVFAGGANLIHAYMPDTLPKMRRWVRSVAYARDLGPPFIEWTARNCLSIDETLNATLHILSDLKDWVRASYRASIPDYVWRAAQPQGLSGGDGAEFITRLFSADMSLRTVRALSDEWHSVVAERGEVPGGNYEFPAPWYPGGELQGYSIEPIETAAALYHEGKSMHHCASIYAGDVARLDMYVYSVRKAGEQVATIDIVKADGRIALRQIRGRCNSKATASVTRAVRAWIRQSKQLHGDAAPNPPQRNVTPLFDCAGGRIAELFDDDIPF